MYRRSDLTILQEIFDRSTNDIALLYGERSCGLLEIVNDLMKDKECMYYRACSVSEEAQKEMFYAELFEQTKFPIIPSEDYEKMITSYINDPSGRKKLIILDDFQFIIKEHPSFINFLTYLLFEKCENGRVMYLLVSDDIRWIERDMVKIIGKKSSEISRVLKINEYSPMEFRDCFPDMPLSEMVAIYSFIGGKSMYYNGITKDTTLHDLILNQLHKSEQEYYNANLFLPREIREPNLYNTLLYYLAAGRCKLNDLYKLTGMERAKLSVYLKMLMDCGIVEKKGTGSYWIKESMTRFYYRFMFPHLSSLATTGANRFYKKFIENGLSDFIADIYPLFCMEQIKWLKDRGRLNFNVASIEEFYDKYKAIDFTITAVGSNVIACSCSYDLPRMPYTRYEDVKESVKKNRLNCENIWLFSATGFDEKLCELAKEDPSLKLIEGSDQRLH